MLENNEHFKIVNARFPHIGNKLKFYWGTKECVSYFSSLFNDDRIGRQGFPSDILFALFSLSQQHADQYPGCERKLDLWDKIY